MTVGEVIELLRKFPADAPVYRYDSEWGPLLAKLIDICKPAADFFNDKARPEGVVIR